MTAATHDRAAIKVHDIGLRLHRNDAGEAGFEVLVGGGLGRTPFIAKTIRAFLPKRDMVSYVEAILRVYNQYGRRDNIYKARIKILVHELGAEAFAGRSRPSGGEIKDEPAGARPGGGRRHRRAFPLSRLWLLDDAAGARRGAQATAGSTPGSAMPSQAQGARLCHRHDVAEAGGRPAGRCDRGADGSDRRSGRALSFGEIRVGHEQNLVLPHVAQRDCTGCGERSTPSASPRRISVSSPTSSPAPGSIIAASPMRAPSRSPRRSAGASAIAK